MCIEVQVGCPRWFLEKGFMEKKYCTKYNTNIGTIQDNYKTVQEVCADHPGNDELIFNESKKEIIKLPFQCCVDNNNFKEMLTHSKGVKLVRNKGVMHKQFSMTIEVKLESGVATAGLLIVLLKC